MSETEGVNMGVEVNTENYFEDVHTAINSLIGTGVATSTGIDYKKRVASIAMQWYLGAIAGGNHEEGTTDLPVKTSFVESKIKDNSGKYNLFGREEARQNFLKFPPFEHNLKDAFKDDTIHWSYLLYHYFAFLQESINEAVEAVEEKNPEKRAKIIRDIKKKKRNEYKSKFLNLVSTHSGEYCMTKDEGCEKERMATLLVLTHPRVLKCFMFDIGENHRSLMNSNSDNAWKSIRNNNIQLLQYFDFHAIHRTWNFTLVMNLGLLFPKTHVLAEFLKSYTRKGRGFVVEDGKIVDFENIPYLAKVWDKIIDYFAKPNPVLHEGIFFLQRCGFIKLVDDNGDIVNMRFTDFFQSVNGSQNQVSKRKRKCSPSLKDVTTQSEKKTKTEQGSESLNGSKPK